MMDAVEAIDSEEVRILPPDRSLHRKLGNVDLDLLLPQSVIEEAQKVIERSSGTFLDESLSEVKRLESLVFTLTASSGKAAHVMPEIVKLAFSIKAKTGLGGYDLVATIAKSLQLFCEKLGVESLTVKNREIVEWHVESLKRLLALRIKGSGGTIGEAILAELAKTNELSSSS